MGSGRTKWPTELQKRIDAYRKRLEEARRWKRLCLLGAGVCAAATPLIFVIPYISSTLGLMLLAYAMMLLAAALYFRVHELDRRLDIQDSEGEKDLLTMGDTSNQQRAETSIIM